MNTHKKLYRSIAGLLLATMLLLLIPLVAMQFTDEVVWTISDFMFAGLLIFSTGLTYKLITQKNGAVVYRVAVGFALFTALLLVWVNLAVGIVGSEDNTINLWYFGVVGVGIIGAFIAQFRAKEMVLAMVVMAVAQAFVTFIALLAGMSQLPSSSLIEIIGVNGFFIVLFVLSALLFWYAQHRPGMEPKITR